MKTQILIRKYEQPNLKLLFSFISNLMWKFKIDCLYLRKFFDNRELHKPIMLSLVNTV